MSKRERTGVSPYEQRLRGTHQKLRSALDRLLEGRATHPTLKNACYRLTATTLAREARISRNAIYTNHRAMLDELQAAARPSGEEGSRSSENRLTKQHALIEAMKATERRLATENAALLKRALDAEAEAERHRKHNARLIAERDAALRPVPIGARKVR